MVPSQSAESDVSTLPDLLEPSELGRMRGQAFYIPFHRRFSHDDRLKPPQGQHGALMERRGEGRGGGRMK